MAGATHPQQTNPDAPSSTGVKGWLVRAFWPAMLLAALVAITISIAFSTGTPSSTARRVEIPYSPAFVSEVQAGNVRSVTSTGATVHGTFRAAVHYPKAASPASTEFVTTLPQFVDNAALMRTLQAAGVEISATSPSTGPSTAVTLLIDFGPLLLIVALVVLFMRRSAGGATSGMPAFGRSSARRVEPSDGSVTFADVAGITEAKEELTEIGDFLGDPEKYRRLGGRIPRGVLLTGPPGTGKTLLARALAGEAGVPFFSLSASEFVEMFVGVGASRVRDLFARAKEAAPAIVFIDELDAIGRSRSGHMPGMGSGAHDEREQTLNQILTEMDGFDPITGVIVIAATNRPEVLDSALLRPGRFDRHVTVQPPDTVGRREILAVHTRSVPLAEDVDLDRLAASTPGMVGADLANLVNEGALMAARRCHDAVTMSDLHDSLEKIVLGSERRILLGDEERRRIAYHEAGHAIVGMLTEGADPVRKVSIIPRGAALGVTLSSPEMDRFNYGRRYLLGRLNVALGGRVAEELVFDDITTGAQNDIKQATRLARGMVGSWGMSEALGPIAVLPEEGELAIPGMSEFSPETQQLVDGEVKRLIDTAHSEVIALLDTNRAKLDALAAALLEHETLDQDDVYRAAGIEPPAPAELAA